MVPFNLVVGAIGKKPGEVLQDPNIVAVEAVVTYEWKGEGQIQHESSAICSLHAGMASIGYSFKVNEEEWRDKMRAIGAICGVAFGQPIPRNCTLRANGIPVVCTRDGEKWDVGVTIPCLMGGNGSAGSKSAADQALEQLSKVLDVPIPLAVHRERVADVYGSGWLVQIVDVPSAVCDVSDPAVTRLGYLKLVVSKRGEIEEAQMTIQVEGTPDGLRKTLNEASAKWGVRIDLIPSEGGTLSGGLIRIRKN